MSGAATPQVLENLKARLPAQGWDSHMHILDPVKFPLAKSALYTPPVHTVPDANKIHKTYNMTKMCIVQPSCYDNDNACVMAGLKEAGGIKGGCAVNGVDLATIDDATIDDWHAKGVRGVRVNFASLAQSPNKALLEKQLLDHAKVAKRHDWVLQVYSPMSTVSFVEELIPKLGLRVCFDHFGCPALPSAKNANATPIKDAYSLAGFKSLANLLKNSETYVKLSAPYRLSKDVLKLRDIEVVAKEFLRIAPKKVVFGTDWPHTRSTGIEIPLFATKMIEWSDEIHGANGQKVVEDLFRNNADGLWSSRKSKL